MKTPIQFKYAKEEAQKSSLRTKVGAVITIGKMMLRGHNQGKTHPTYANPLIHERTSLHAELACLVGMKRDFDFEKARVFVYREVDGHPALARPCEHCLEFLKEMKVKEIYFTIKEFPYWDMEELK